MADFKATPASDAFAIRGIHPLSRGVDEHVNNFIVRNGVKDEAFRIQEASFSTSRPGKIFIGISERGTSVTAEYLEREFRRMGLSPERIALDPQNNPADRGLLAGFFVDANPIALDFAATSTRPVLNPQILRDRAKAALELVNTLSGPDVDRTRNALRDLSELGYTRADSAMLGILLKELKKFDDNDVAGAPGQHIGSIRQMVRDLGYDIGAYSTHSGMSTRAEAGTVKAATVLAQAGVALDTRMGTRAAPAGDGSERTLS